MAIDAFALEHAEEAFHRGVVTTMAYRTHDDDDDDDVVVLQELLVIRTGELRAAIRVQDHRTAIGSLPAGHHYRLDHHVPIQHRRHRPADHFVGGQAQHCTQIQPTFAGLDEDDVDHPLGVRFRCLEIALQVIARIRWPHASGIAPPLPLLWHTQQTVARDEARHAVQSGGLAFIAQSSYMRGVPIMPPLSV